MHEFLDPLILAVEHVINIWCLIAIFEGTRRTRKTGARWWKSKLLIVGVLWALFAGGQNLAYLYIATDTHILEDPEPPSIGPEWGENLTPEKRAKDSRALASVAIRWGNRDAKAFDLSGTLVPYCPSADDIAAHDQGVRTLAALRSQVEDWKENAIQWFTSIIIAVGLALMASHPKHAKSIGFDS